MRRTLGAATNARLSWFHASAAPPVQPACPIHHPQLSTPKSRMTLIALNKLFFGSPYAIHVVYPSRAVQESTLYNVSDLHNFRVLNLVRSMMIASISHCEPRGS